MELRKGKVEVPKGAKHSYTQAKGGRDHVTVQCCVSAAVNTIPPITSKLEVDPLRGIRKSDIGRSGNRVTDSH